MWPQNGTRKNPLAYDQNSRARSQECASHNQKYSWNLLDENPIRLHGGVLGCCVDEQVPNQLSVMAFEAF
jgi:hypothetical protein